MVPTPASETSFTEILAFSLGDYPFEKPLQEGDKLVFCDMAHYSMVKNNTFNGMNLPSIYLYRQDTLIEIKHFDYETFKARL